MASVQAKVVVVARAVCQLSVVGINVLPNGLWSAEIEWCSRHVCLRLWDQGFVNFQVRVRKNLQNVVQNATILLTVQIEVGVVCWVEQSGAVTLAKVLDTKSFANNGVFYAVVHLVWVTLVKVFACGKHHKGVPLDLHVVHLFVETLKATVQVVWPIVAIKVVVYAIQSELALCNAVATSAYHATHVVPFGTNCVLGSCHAKRHVHHVALFVRHKQFNYRCAQLGYRHGNLITQRVGVDVLSVVVSKKFFCNHSCSPKRVC